MIELHAPTGEPSITDPPSNDPSLVDREKLVGGGAVSYPCVASGIPAPSIAWFYNGEVVSDGGEVTVGADNTLSIAEPRVSHSGIYQCFATNVFGVATRDVILEVRELGM